MRRTRWVVWIIIALAIARSATGQSSRACGLWTGTWYVDEKRTSNGDLYDSPPYPSEPFSLHLQSYDPATNRFGYVTFSGSYPAGDIIALSVNGALISLTIDYSPHSTMPADPAYHAHIVARIEGRVMQGDFDESNPAPAGWISFLGPFILRRTKGGFDLKQITDRSGGGGPCSNCCHILHRQPILAPSGDQFVFASTWNRDGTTGNPNTDRNTEVFRYDIASGLYLEDTLTDVGISAPFDFTDTLVAFVSSSPELPANTDMNADLFLYPIALPTDAQAMTFTAGPIAIDHGRPNPCPEAWFPPTNWWTLANTHADISADDGFVAWAGNRNIPSAGAPAGTNSDENYEIWLKDLNSGAVRQITQTTGEDAEAPSNAANLWPRVCTGGCRVVFVSNRGPDGSSIMTNRHGLFLWTPSGITRLTPAELVVEREFPAFGMDEAGARVVFAADADLTGHNADGNVEIFAVSVPSGVVTQLTDTVTGVTHSRPILSGDGKKLAFLSNGDFSGCGQNADGSEELWMYHFDSDRFFVNPFVQVTSLPSTPSAKQGRTHWMDWYSLDRDGSHVAMCTDGDLTGKNAEQEYEIFLATFDWDPEPEVIITGVHENAGTPVLQWQGNRTNLLYMVEYCTNLPAAGWAPAIPSSQWWISGTTWTNTGPARSGDYFRIKTKER